MPINRTKHPKGKMEGGWPIEWHPFPSNTYGKRTLKITPGSHEPLVFNETPHPLGAKDPDLLPGIYTTSRCPICGTKPLQCMKGNSGIYIYLSFRP